MIKLMKEVYLSASLETDKVINSFEHVNFDHGRQLTCNSRKEFFSNGLIRLYPEHQSYIEDFLSESFAEFRELCEVRVEREYRPLSAFYDREALINLTDIAVPDDIGMALAFGPKFCFPPANTLDNFILFVDDFCGHLEHYFPVETHTESMKQLSIELNAQRKRFSLTREVWLDFLNYRVKNFVKNHPDVYITRSDKGKHTVLLYKRDYIHKLEQLVSNTVDYIVIKSIDIDRLEAQNNSLVARIGQNSDLPFGCSDHCTLPARMYGLIKIHKKDFPARPIVSACSSPGFKLAKFFSLVLSTTFPEMGFHIKNSVDFIGKLSQTTISDDEIMISFDVTSMFTNIPIDHMIDLIARRGDFILQRFNIKFDLVKEALLFLLKDCAVFACNGLFYKQNDSLAMGSPLSPILAKILMTDLIEDTLSRIRNRPKFLSLYVDDSFWIVDSIDVIHILDSLNLYHPKINFTVEFEKNCQINFLDVSIIRSNNRLITNWYKKPYASSRLLNYFSHHEKSCIIETAKAYVRMVLNISQGNFFEQNRNLLIDILRRNSFPEIEIINIMRTNFTLMSPPIHKEPYTGNYIPIKYWGGLTRGIKKRIEKFISGARIVGTPDKCSTRHFSQIKDQVAVRDKTNLVLIFSCRCGKRLIRHTLHNCRAGDVIDSVHQLFPADVCSGDTHAFVNCRTIQCKNYRSTKRVYSLYTYTFRNNLVCTELCLPQYFVCKLINKSLT